jgi:hypothetical protein
LLQRPTARQSGTNLKSAGWMLSTVVAVLSEGLRLNTSTCLNYTYRMDLVVFLRIAVGDAGCVGLSHADYL